MSDVHFDFPNRFTQLYQQAVEAYQNGTQSPAELFNEEQTAWLAANGISAQAMFDYAEDHVDCGEPGLGNALTIESIRRDYFLSVQQGVASTTVADADSWPAKSEEIDGIRWLPRILPKVRAKLRGELPNSMMYCCGGDRAFFKTNNIMPAEFLNLAWRHFDDEQAIIDWVKQRTPGVPA